MIQERMCKGEMSVKKGLLSIGVTCLVLLALHATPQAALRTYVCLMGHPIAALTSPITEDDARNELEQKDFEERNGKIYTLINPPVERATQGRLESYFVRKVGPFYLAEHHGGG
ncbi:hypothetical protein [Exiguobacterium alkaliphilum]|uniref:Uncharacterized protein n=1 Tax=Exiguobacterium alkaliphilum TaxID=1428684 RepID=A0ABT2KV11_9BACL|nr:hypothetical protein [Exiguobacterium alkaliphilum]MCT4794256.1 hypothetical protein [Exiguobacterium alkaliphilum]